MPGVYRTQANDVLLGALSVAVAEWTGQDRVLVNLETSYVGRRSVTWTQYRPGARGPKE